MEALTQLGYDAGTAFVEGSRVPGKLMFSCFDTIALIVLFSCNLDSSARRVSRQIKHEAIEKLVFMAQNSIRLLQTAQVNAVSAIYNIEFVVGPNGCVQGWRAVIQACGETMARHWDMWKKQ